MDEITFNCDPEAEADLHPLEGRCCCWLFHHTYDLYKEYTIKKIEGEINTGPSEYPTYYPIDIEVSLDKQNWTKIGQCGAKGTEKYVAFTITTNAKARYIRFKTQNQTYAIDGSRGTIYIESSTPPPPPPPPSPTPSPISKWLFPVISLTTVVIGIAKSLKR